MRVTAYMHAVRSVDGWQVASPSLGALKGAHGAVNEPEQPAAATGHRTPRTHHRRMRSDAHAAQLGSRARS